MGIWKISMNNIHTVEQENYLQNPDHPHHVVFSTSLPNCDCTDAAAPALEDRVALGMWIGVILSVKPLLQAENRYLEWTVKEGDQLLHFVPLISLF